MMGKPHQAIRAAVVPTRMWVSSWWRDDQKSPGKPSTAPDSAGEAGITRGGWKHTRGTASWRAVNYLHPGITVADIVGEGGGVNQSHWTPLPRLPVHDV